MLTTKIKILIAVFLVGTLIPIVYYSIRKQINTNSALIKKHNGNNSYDYIGEDSDKCVVYLKNGTIDKKLKRVWIKIVYSINSPLYMQDASKIAFKYDNAASREQISKVGNYLDHKIEYIQINCGEKTIKVLVSNLMDGNDVPIMTADDKGLNDEINLAPKGFESQPNVQNELASGLNESILEIVCGSKKDK